MEFSADNYRTLLKNAPQAIVITDPEGAIVYVNSLAEKMFGYVEDELLGQTLADVFPEHTRQLPVGRRVTRFSTRPMGEGRILVARRKDGTEFPVEVGLSFISTEAGPFVATHFTDISRRQQAEQELLQLNARLAQRTKQLTALNEIGRTLAATLDLREIYWVMYHGIAQGLLSTPHLTVALFDEETDTIYCGFAIVDGEEMDPDQFPPMPLGEGPVSDTIRTREPRIVDLREIIAALAENGRGAIVGDARQPQSALYVPMVGGDTVVGVMHFQHYLADAFREMDLPTLSTLASQAAVAITNARLYVQEHKRATELARTLKQQRELDSLKDQFIQNVSHELRTPLSIVHAYVELLDSGALGELSPEHKEPITIVARRTRMLRELVENFTTMVESETRKSVPEPVQLSDLVKASQQDFQVAALEAHVELDTEIEPNVAPVLGNRMHLDRVLDNLLSNAIKFTPAGGRINVNVRLEANEAVLEVKDTGAGIPHEQLARVFDRFYQVDGSMSRRHGGTGLGLALVKEIVEAHGGQVAAESNVGSGSTFQVRLPVM